MLYDYVQITFPDAVYLNGPKQGQPIMMHLAIMEYIPVENVANDAIKQHCAITIDGKQYVPSMVNRLQLAWLQGRGCDIVELNSYLYDKRE